MIEVPVSAYTPTNGMLYFARMLDKMRKYAKGSLREDFWQHLGKGLDGRICNYLRIDYTALREECLQQQLDDQQLLAWCFENGRALDESDIHIWNEFVRKLGWNDEVSAVLQKRIGESGLQAHSGINTMLEYFEYDEGRKS